MAWEGLVGHTEQIDMLRRSMERGRLGHTYLLTGPSGVGKRRFALAWAECLLCESANPLLLESCGHCSACKQVRARTHPDLLLVGRPEGKSEIPIDLLLGPSERRGTEGFCHDLALRPMSGTRKVAIIDDADRLNDEGANCLLKTLEEPPEHSLLILVATTPDAMLPTIRSRCQMLRFQPLAEEHVRDILLREGMTESAQEAAEVAALCDGSLDTAAQLLAPHLREQRLALYDGLAAECFESPQLSEKMIAAIEQAGTETSVQRDHAAWLIHFCIEFYRRALVHLAGGTVNDGGGSRVGSADQAAKAIPQVTRFVKHFPHGSPRDLEVVGELLERSMAAERNLESKVTVPLCLEALFDDLGRIGRAS